MLIEPAVHERFVQDFGINMLNTLTVKDNRQLAHKRRIFVFDERGGVFGGSGRTLQAYQNLTTGVFHSNKRRIVGVRYRCRPNTLEVPEIGAFHTHPVAFSTSVRQVRQRIEHLLWLSDMDVKAFLKQYELYGYEWHFIGSMDIGCFHIDDVRRDHREPREVIRYPKLEEAMADLAPQIRFYDQILQSSASAAPSHEVLAHVIQDLTAQKGDLLGILASHDPEAIPLLAGKVASRFQLLGYSSRQVSTLLRKTVGKAGKEATVLCFQDHLASAYDRLSALSS
ncbi:MAG TPA: hypothetical protein V6D00_05340 [Pantanalinema sp.]